MKALSLQEHCSFACRVAGLLAAGALSLASAPASSQITVTETHEGFVHELTADKGAYVMYEDVAVEYTVTNESGEPVWMWFPCSSVAIRIAVRDADDELLWVSPPGCLDSFWDDILDPGESYERADAWDMVDHMTGWPITEPGIYTVQGVLTAYNDPHAYVVSLPVSIFDETTTVPAVEEASWTTIKALYQ